MALHMTRLIHPHIQIMFSLPLKNCMNLHTSLLYSLVLEQHILELIEIKMQKINAVLLKKWVDRIMSPRDDLTIKILCDNYGMGQK